LLKVFTTLTRQIYITETLSHNAFNRLHESTRIVVFALIEAKCLLVQIPEQMKRLAINIGAFDAALEQAPEIFKSVGVNVALGVANRMVD
jgi:hypothetical protein